MIRVMFVCHGNIRNLPVGNTEVVAKKIHALIDSDLFFYRYSAKVSGRSYEEDQDRKA